MDNNLGLVWEENNSKFDKTFSKIDYNYFDENIKGFFLNEDINKSLNYLNKDFDNEIDMSYINFVGKLRRSNPNYRYKHSEWLNYAENCLSLVYNLLKDTGFIFIKVEDNYVAHLKLLCDKLFEESNFVTNFCLPLYNREELNKDFILNHLHILCYRKTNKARLKLLNTSQSFIKSRITKKGNNVSIIELNKGIRCEENITKTFRGIIGGKNEPIKIMNEEGMIIQNGVLINDIKIKGPFCNPNYIKRYFSGEKIIDKRNQKLIEVYLKRNGIPYTIKTKKGELPTSILSGLKISSEEIKKHDVNIINDVDSLLLIKRLILLSLGKTNGTILCLFANS